MSEYPRKRSMVLLLAFVTLAATEGRAHGQFRMFQPSSGAMSRPSFLTSGIGMSPVAALGTPGGAGAFTMPFGAPNTGNALTSSAYGGGASPYSSGYGTPSSGYSGDPVADEIKAQGQLLVNQQQAYSIREKVRADRIDNKRKAFDEYLYEKERTPTAEEERQRLMQGRLSRARNNPPQSEIWSGTALNELQAGLRKTVDKPTSDMSTLANILDEDTLKHINITSGRGDGNAGLLKTGGKLPWPDGLMDNQYKEERERISSQVADAVKQAELNHQVDSGTIRQLTQDTDALAKKLRKQVGDMAPGGFIEASAFLNSLTSSITILKQRDVGNYFSGKYDLKAKNVQELVKYMSDKGLQFTKALPGDESAYLSLYQSMANYDTALRAVALP